MKLLSKILMALLMIWSNTVLAETFQATVNRTEVPEGETFLLTLETDDNSSDTAPDLSVLNNDFKVYSVGSAFQSSFVNGITKHSRQWQIVLMPQKSGQIEIPAIKYNNLFSKPIQLTVTPSHLITQPQAGKEEPKFAVEAEISNKNPFVQQQVVYTYKIYDSGGLYGDMPVVMDDGSNDWIIQGLGEPIVNNKVINGRQFREIEFKFALFPQKSGKLKTPDIEFKGYYVTQNNQYRNAFDDIFNRGFFNVDVYDMFATRHPIVLKPKPITVDVKPIPQANNGYWWLPASEVILTSEWNDKNPVFRVGEAVGLSVYLKAVGVIENQLPDIKFKEISGIKQYPEKPITMGSKNKDNIISIKKFSTVFIPEKAGKMEIPEISIDWYNINSGQIEKAVLPAQTITVLAGEGGGEGKEQPLEIKQPEATTVSQPSNEVKNQEQAEFEKTSLPLGVLLVLTFGLGVVVSWFLFGRKSRQISTVKDSAKKVELAASGGDIKKLRDNLLEWARQAYQQEKITNLNELKKYGISSNFQSQLELIGKMLYSAQSENFDADKFIRIFREEQKKQKQQSVTKIPLPKLYK